jgi:Fur family ferric uptake transcriptional regulator/Fur family peroxide stress response transcriptional regulator
VNSILNSKKRLEKHGIKPSLQRMAVMDYLMTHRTHPTVEMIFNDLSPDIPTLSKTTVYNTVKLLAEHEAILTLNIDEKNVRYDGDISPHAHFRCKLCGNIHDFPIERMEIKHPECEGFTISETQVYYSGFCRNCKN